MAWASRRRTRKSGRQSSRQRPGNSLTTTIVTVLLTFFLTTVGGGLLSFWTRLNENATIAAQVEMQNGLDAYGRYLKEIEPRLARSQDIGVAILRYSERHPRSNIHAYAVRETARLPDVNGFLDNGSMDLYLGREAAVGLHALGGQHLAMRVMIERNAASGAFPASSLEVMTYLTDIRISYTVYLLNILKCKQRVAKTFMLWGKLDAMERCEAPPKTYLDQWKTDIWGPGIFDVPKG